MMHQCIQTEKVAVIETHINYIRDTVGRIDKKVEELAAFKLKVIGAASTIAAIVSYITVIIVG